MSSCVMQTRTPAWSMRESWRGLRNGGGGGVMAEGVFPRLTRMALGSDIPLLFHARSRVVPFLAFVFIMAFFFSRLFSPLPFSNSLSRRKLRFILPHFLAATSLLASHASDSVVALFFLLRISKVELRESFRISSTRSYAASALAAAFKRGITRERKSVRDMPSA